MLIKVNDTCSIIYITESMILPDIFSRLIQQEYKVIDTITFLAQNYISFMLKIVEI